MTMHRRMALRAETEEQGGRLRFVLATEGRKSDGIDLRMSNVDLARFKANPVVLALHDYWSLPVGRAENIEIDGKRLLADAIFDTDDEVGAALDRKYRAGFMNAVSIGFDAYDVGDDGVPKRWEPLEFSAVPIPMDGDALVESGRQMRALLAALRAPMTDGTKTVNVDLDGAAIASSLDTGNRSMKSAIARLRLDQMLRETV